MRDNWKTVKLGDVVTFQRGFDITKKEQIQGYFPVVSSSGINSYHNKFKVKSPGIVIGRKGTLGTVFYLNKDFWPHDTTLWVKNFHDNYPLFIYYFLKSFNFKQYDVGTSNPTLNRNHIHHLISLIPPLPEQKAIARILGSLDDKIELNRQMNRTLEDMAQAIFKAWFVDFEPFKNGNFIESELGLIPEGWKVGIIGEFLITVLGGTPSRKIGEYWTNGTIPWINSGEVNNFRVIKPTEHITELGLSKSATKLLPKRTTLIAITGATLGQVSLSEIECCANQSVIGIIGSSKLPNEFVYFWLKNNITDLINMRTGGAQQHINKNNVNSLKILVTPPEIMTEFVKIVKPFFDRISTNLFEIQSLTKTRDTLLPKLVSGEIRVG